MINETPEDLKRAVESCSTAQAMIDISADHLIAMRTECSTSAEMVQQEIRALESKLIKQFCRQLVAKRKCPNTDELKCFPQLKQWLRVVGLSPSTIELVSSKMESFDDQLAMSESRVKEMLTESKASDEEIRRLITALRNLKVLIEQTMKQGKVTVSDVELCWDSWDRNADGSAATKLSTSSPRINRNRNTNKASCDVEQNDGSMKCSPISPPQSSSSNNPFSPTFTAEDMSDPFKSGLPPLGEHSSSSSPPPTPMSKKSPSGRPSRTPPPRKKHQTLLSEPFPLTKSKSHEENLSNRIQSLEPTRDQISCGATSNSFNSLPHQSYRRRLATEPGFSQTSPVISPSRSPPLVSPENQLDSCFEEPNSNNNNNNMSGQMYPPRSPQARGGMVHVIHHRFVKTVKVTSTMCLLCDKPMYYGYKCKDCKYKCHNTCMDKVPPSCGLPEELLLVYKRTFQDQSTSDHGGNSSSASSTNTQINDILSPLSVKSEPGGGSKIRTNKKSNGTLTQPVINVTPFGGPDSSSNTSSCTSSTPSSPAILTGSSNLPTPLSASLQVNSFNFPDVSNNGPISGQRNNFMSMAEPIREVAETQKSNDSDKTVSMNSGSTSTDSERTIAGRLDSQDSTVSEVDSHDKWPRQNSLTAKEWEIPFDELKLGDKIGTGRFGVVFKGQWHGAVAVKMLHMEEDLDRRQYMEAFKQEVATLRKTRHENLVLFMGACPPQLAIVTSLCKGDTLYTLLHLKNQKFPANRALLIAQQICQGMSYLHARDIVHKDLKSKNVFYENGKVIITDFGLLSVTRMCQGSRKGEWLTIPNGWLCYLAPEIMRCLRPGDQQSDELPFSSSSDVFAFGTLWYELLYGEWPFKGQPPEVIMWQVSRGFKPPLSNLQASKEIKDLLMVCWEFNQEKRPGFSGLLETLTKLPKKRLQRSPSHPVQMIRSAESNF